MTVTEADETAVTDDPAKSNGRAPVRIMVRLLAERKGLFATNLGLRLVKDLLPFLGPILVGMVVDLLSGSSGRDRTLFGIELTQNDVRSIVIIAIVMAILAVAKTVVGYVHTIVAAHMGRHVVQAARRDLAEAAMQMSLDERRRFNSGDLLDRCLADSKGLRSFTQNVIIRVISNTVRAVFPLVYMFMIDPLLALVVLAVIPLQSTVSGLLQRRLQRQTHEARSREATHTSAVKEAIDGWNNVASVGGQDWAAQGINDTAAASEDAKIVKKHTTASISAVISLCTAFGIAAVYAIGGWRIIESGALSGTGEVAAGALSLGTLTAFIGVAKKTYAPFQAYTKIVSSYRTGLVNLERIADVLDAPMIDPRHDGPALRVSNGNILLDNVSFSYSNDDAPTLRALTGLITGRSLTVITGPSGAGKTTLLRLLLGLDVPSTGTVSIDGQDINATRFSSVQEAIALVPQEPVLFTGTLSENLLLGLEDVSAKRLLESCERAGLLELVRELPKGLDTEVGSGKHMLSGGQLRRMAIARALLREPGVLLLDEPTAGLDVKNSMLVLNTLRRISNHTTVVMVSHRSEPLKASDQHLMLSDGGWSNSVEHHDGPTAEEIDLTASSLPLNATVNGSADHASASGSADYVSASGHDPDANADAASITDSPAPSGTPYAPTLAAVHAPRHDHVAMDHRVLALSAMGRPIVLNGLESASALARVMVISGHRSLARPITAISPALFAQVATDTEAVVAIASIEDVNPDGAFSSRSETVLGVEVESDHGALRAAETRTLQLALVDWRANLVIDVAEQLIDLASTLDVEVVVRFRPDANGGAPASATALGREIRQRLDQSPFEYRVKLVGCAAGSLTCERNIPVVELSTQDGSDPLVLRAIIDAALATCRASATVQELVAV